MQAEPINAQVVERLRMCLRENGVSHAALARALGISKTSMQRRLNEEVPLNLDEVERIADALEVPAQELLLVS